MNVVGEDFEYLSTDEPPAIRLPQVVPPQPTAPRLYPLLTELPAPLPGGSNTNRVDIIVPPWEQPGSNRPVPPQITAVITGTATPDNVQSPSSNPLLPILVGMFLLYTLSE